MFQDGSRVFLDEYPLYSKCEREKYDIKIQPLRRGEVIERVRYVKKFRPRTIISLKNDTRSIYISCLPYVIVEGEMARFPLGDYQLD